MLIAYVVGMYYVVMYYKDSWGLKNVLQTSDLLPRNNGSAERQHRHMDQAVHLILIRGTRNILQYGWANL